MARRREGRGDGVVGDGVGSNLAGFGQVDLREARAVRLEAALGDDERRVRGQRLLQRRGPRDQRHLLEGAPLQVARVHGLKQAVLLPEVHRLVDKGDSRIGGKALRSQSSKVITGAPG